MTRLPRQLWILLLVVGVVLACPLPARALPSPLPEDSAGWIWTPMRIHRHVRAKDLLTVTPFVARRTPEGVSPVTVATGLGALVWVDGMSTIRVRKVNPTGPGHLRFRRLDTGASAKALVDAPAIPGGEGTWFITQPTASGSAWLIEADRPTAISVDEPRPREGRLIWEHLEDRIVAWIEGNGELPDMPPVEGKGAFQTRLEAHRQVATALLAGGPEDEPLKAALTAWQHAQALQELARIHPLVRPGYVSRRLRWKNKVPVRLPHLNALVEMGETPSHPYFRIENDEAWQIQARGPGVLRVTARALFIGSTTERILHVSVLADGREVERLDVRLRPSSVRDPSTNAQPIPVYTEAVTEHGDRMSRPVVLSVPLLVGVHTYTIQVEGGPAIVKARAATRNHRSASLADGRSPRAQMRKGLRHLRKTADPRSKIVRWLLLRLQFQDPGTIDPGSSRKIDPLVADWIRAVAFDDATKPEELRAIAANLSRRSRASPSPLELDLRWRLFRRLHGVQRSDLATAILIERIRRLDSDAFLGLVLALPGDMDIAPVAQALEIVARGIPLDDSLRRAHLELWRYTAWDRLRPSPEPQSWTWLATDHALANDSTPSDDPSPGILWSMDAGSLHDLDVSTSGPLESSILSTVVVTPPDSSGPVALHLDGRRWDTLVVAPTARFETLLPAGRHEIRVDGPPGTRVFTSLPNRPRTPLLPTERAETKQPDAEPETASAHEIAGDPSPTRIARRHRLWSLPRGEGKLRFDLDPPPVGTLLRIDLRAVPWGNPLASADAPKSAPETESVTKPSAIAVKTNNGPVRHVTFWPGEPDRLAIPEDAAGTASDRVLLTFALEPGTEWIEIDNTGPDDLAAAVYVRRWEAPAPTGVPETGDDASRSDILGHIARLGREIVQDPENPSLYLQRAHLLLNVDAVGPAQQDHDRILELLNEAWDEPLAHRLRALEANIDRHRSRTALALHDPTLRDRPLLLAPALAEVASGPDLAAWSETAASLRRGDMSRWIGAADTPVARALAAVMAEQVGQHDRAAFLWSELYDETVAVAIGLAAADQFRAALDAGQESDPAFAFGFVRALQTVIDSPRLRRLAFLASQRSRWTVLRYVDASAGVERLGTPLAKQDEPEETSAWLLVLSPPWDPSQDNVIRPGSTMVVDLPPVATRFDMFCQAVRGPKANRRDSGLTGLDVIVDGTLVAHHEVASGDLLEHEIQPRAPSGHKVSFRLDGADSRFLCSVRRPKNAKLESILETRQWLTARPRQPVRTSILGPTVLRIDTRHGAPHLHRSMPVFVGIEHDASRRVVSLVLPSDADPETRVTAGTRRPLGSNVRTEILISERGPVTISLEPAFAQVMTRIAIRESFPPSPPSPDTDLQAPTYPKLEAKIADLGKPYWPSTPPIVLDQSISEPSRLTTNRLGALEAELRVGRDDIAEFDQFRPRLRVRNTLRWRRELLVDHLWIRAGVAGQWRDLSGFAGGLDGRVYGQFGPRRLRGNAGTSLWLEEIAGRPEWAARFFVSMDWPIQLVNRLTLVPELTTSYRHQSLSRSEASVLLEGVHPEVYSNYVEDHPLVFTPAVIARIRPLQDQLVALGVSTTPNSDFRSNERTDMDAEVLGIIDSRSAWLFFYRAGYQASLRFADEDRSDFYVRNRIRAGLEITYLFIGAGRLSFAVQDSVYLSRLFATQNVIEFVLAFDLAVGRGIRDTSPMELLFRNLYQLRWWKQGEEDDLL